ALGYIEKEETLNYLAYYDVLTGLPNRTLFLERVNQVIRSAQQDNGRLALVLFDLQRFRAINDTLGRQVSDTLLKLVATRMQECLGERGWNARIGGNTFAVALSDIKQETDIAHILEGRILECLRQPFVLDNTELRLAARCGVTLFPGDGTDADSLLKNAEAALKKAKDTAEHYLFYAPEMNARVGEQLNLENRLRVALVERQFVLHYQPIIDSGSGRVVGLEALIRWMSPGLGLVSPAEFVPILEETGMILEAGTWVLRQAASDYRQWRAKGLKPPRIAVNISALQMRQKDFAERVQAAMRGEDGEMAALDLEITESVIMTDIEQSIPKLEAVRALGAGIAIDDFGTGYSSLSYLARLPVTALKIDRMFVENMVVGPDSMAIVSSVISLAHSLNLKVVAEGVETDEQSNLLKLLKCDELQGYVFSYPQPVEAVEAMLSGEA
ncbi:MAG: EAL domain-containing protein, partial [Betaproteobacteria bacterium]|nr:EAL domain-containing protein [Betaproteobacteria bacterium]